VAWYHLHRESTTAALQKLSKEVDGMEILAGLFAILFILFVFVAIIAMALLAIWLIKDVLGELFGWWT
jgi:hypothetical protein